MQEVILCFSICFILGSIYEIPMFRIHSHLEGTKFIDVLLLIVDIFYFCSLFKFTNVDRSS